MLSQLEWYRPACFSVCSQALAAGGSLSSELKIIADAVLKVVRVNEVVPGIVGGGDVDHLHFSAVALLSQSWPQPPFQAAGAG